MPMMKIYMPSCLVNYFIGFGIFNAEAGAVGAFVKNIVFVDGVPLKGIDYKFIRNGFWYPHFLYTCSDVIGLTFIALFIIVILYVLT